MLTIGPYSHASQVVVAPMAGVTDRPFRRLCHEFGARWTVSEMVTSDRRLWHTEKSRHRLGHADEPGVSWVQLAGADPAMMADAARANVDLGADIIDINMGCPAKKVCNRAAGSALLRDEALVGEILDAVVNAVDVPVTLKIRLGWSPEETNAESIAAIAEDAGVQLLTVHGRTRACRFQGEVNYDAITRVCDSTSLPVIANGDIDTAEKAAAVLKQTGAAAIMIGRAAQGRPWLPGQVDQYLRTGVLAAEPETWLIAETLVKHVASLHQFYGDLTGLRIARKHVGWTLDDQPHWRPLKSVFNHLESPEAQLAFLSSLPEKGESCSLRRESSQRAA